MWHVDVQVTPDKIEIPIPAYFKRDRAEALAYWDIQLKVGGGRTLTRWIWTMYISTFLEI